MKNLNPQISDAPEKPMVAKQRAVHKRREVRLNLAGDFDAAQTVERIADLSRPAGYYERIILDFSDTFRIKPGKLYRLFAELSNCPEFNYIEIRIEGLRFGYEIGTAEFAEDRD